MGVEFWTVDSGPDSLALAHYTRWTVCSSTPANNLVCVFWRPRPKKKKTQTRLHVRNENLKNTVLRNWKSPHIPCSLVANSHNTSHQYYWSLSHVISYFFVIIHQLKVSRTKSGTLNCQRSVVKKKHLFRFKRVVQHLDIWLLFSMTKVEYSYICHIWLRVFCWRCNTVLSYLAGEGSGQPWR